MQTVATRTTGFPFYKPGVYRGNYNDVKELTKTLTQSHNYSGWYGHYRYRGVTGVLNNEED